MMTRDLDQRFDVIVIGSGATGGLAAMEFCQAGLNVAVLEAGAGPTVGTDPRSTYSCSNVHCQDIQARCYAFNQHTRSYFVDDVSNPYSVPSGRPFSWIRARAVGGKTLLWAGHCYRMSDWDFQAANVDGVGDPWPITYSDIEPYYSRVERILRVRGSLEGLQQVPDGIFEPTRCLTEAEQLLKDGFARVGKMVMPTRTSYARKQIAASQPCRHCGQRGGACSRPVDSPSSTLAAASKTGCLTLLPYSIVHHILTNPDGLATGVLAVDHRRQRTFEIKGAVMFLCASTLESTRIMLNSASPIHPNGLGNSSGTLGHYLMDHVFGVRVIGLLKRRLTNTDSSGGSPRSQLYVPRWQNLPNRGMDNFLRGYSYQVSIVRSEDVLERSVFACGGSLPSTTPASSETKAILARGHFVVELEAFGEMLPHYDNCVGIDKSHRPDAAGVPILKIDCQHRDNERGMVGHMISNAVEMLEATGAEIVWINDAPAEPGLAIHECGTCRMGSNRSRAVLNAFNQCHDVRNVFVTDGSCFPSQGVQNPTLTMMALTSRACHYALEQLRLGELRQTGSPRLGRRRP